MKSFYKFLTSRQEFGENLDINRKPVFRSSAIFPVAKNDSYTSQILFLGYWLIKRNINEVNILLTLRDKTGKMMKRISLLVNSPKSYLIELDSLLTGLQYDSEFIGSLELEIFSTHDMVFPYPALVLNYYGDDFNTCVHTVGRIYNDFEDLRENESFSVPESGFDINATDDLEPFISFVNGPEPNLEGKIKYTITNYFSEKFHGDFTLGKITPYETIFLKLKEKIPKLDTMLKNKPGSISIEHNFKGFFPRFLAGNIQTSFPSLSFTHTYYDCTSCNTETDFWNRESNDYYHCSVYVPIFNENDEFTELVIYPNISPSIFDLQLNLYDSKGNEVYRNESFLTVNTRDSKLQKIDFKELIKTLKIDESKVSSAHIISKFRGKIPSRQKFGLNVGLKNSKSKIPCNICFNSKLGNPLIENKPGSFHWCPVFNDENSVVSFANFSPKKDYTKRANITLKFYNNDSELEKKVVLEPFSEFRLYSNDPQIKPLLHDGPIWVTIESDNPNIQGFYFNFHPSGSVAGDHFF